MRKSDLAIGILFFAVPSIMLLIGFFLFALPLSEWQKTLLLLPQIGGLILLFVGYILDSTPYSTRTSPKLLKMSGWILFSFYWATQPSSLYEYGDRDLINAAICILGVYVLFYFAYREWFIPSKCLNWIAGATSIAGLIYFGIELTPLNLWLREVVASQSAWLLNVFTGEVGVNGVHIKYKLADITIIFACTAIQSMLLFVGMIGALKSKPISKLYGLLATVPTIYILNLVRNAGVIFLVGSGITDINIAHNYIGKIGSLAALICLVFVVFRILPELQNQITSIFDLYKSRGPLERFLVGQRK
jgi:archaeosortase A (PGF-CTERM-specific)